MISKAQDKINNIFSKKCEHNVRIKENPPNKKIIRLPKRLTDITFLMVGVDASIVAEPWRSVRAKYAQMT